MVQCLPVLLSLILKYFFIVRSNKLLPCSQFRNQATPIVYGKIKWSHSIHISRNPIDTDSLSKNIWLFKSCSIALNCPSLKDTHCFAERLKDTVQLLIYIDKLSSTYVDVKLERVLVSPRCQNIQCMVHGINKSYLCITV